MTFPKSMRAPPLDTASLILVQHVLGRDPLVLYDSDPQPEVRSFGKALAAELRGDTAAAIIEYRKSLAAPAKGDLRMLISYELARVLHATGDAAGAAAACSEVIAPRLYLPYRAVLLPDCVLWSGDRAKWQQELAAWKSDFALPAIVEMRRRN